MLGQFPARGHRPTMAERNREAAERMASRIKEAGDYLTSIGQTPTGDVSDLSRASQARFKQTMDNTLAEMQQASEARMTVRRLSR